MNLFFTENIDGKIAILPDDEARHCVQSLRKKAGDTIHFVDGKGGFYTGEITEANRKRCVMHIVEHQQNYGQPEVQLHIAIAPTKNISRLEWFLEKATEIGISEITPIICQHSERKTVRIDRLQKIILTAMKQSLKAYLPKVNELTNFKDFIQAQNSTKSRTFIAHCNEGDKRHLKDICKAKENTLILIGPEGDFSPEEVALALQQQYEAVSLGKSRLRTETAGLAACHIINLVNS